MDDKEVEMEEGIVGDRGSQDDDKERLLNDFEPPAPVEKSIRRWLLGLWTKHRSIIWMVLTTISTLKARTLFRGSFPYPLYFMFILQMIANSSFVLWSIHTSIKGFGEGRWEGKEWRFRTPMAVTILHSQRLFVSSAISATGMLFGAYALSIYPNFHVLALLPIFSYVCDSVLLHIASIVRLHPLQKLATYFNFLGVILISGFCAVLVFTDYRLEHHPVLFALVGLLLESLSRTFLMLYSNVQEQRQESKSFFMFERIVTGIPQLVISAIAAFKFENTIDANHRFQSWGFLSGLGIVLPAVLVLLIFSNGINASYRGPTTEELISVLEDGRPQARTTLQATLHASYLVLAISAFRREVTLLNWFQAIAFASIYVIALGPVHVGYYPLRLHNWTAHLIRRKQRHLNMKSWGLLGFLVSCTVVVWALLSCTSVYWVNTLAYNRSVKTFINPSKPRIDYTYRPPRIRGLEVVIAHARDHPHNLLFEIIDRIRESKEVMGLGPQIKIYTKDNTLLKKVDPQKKIEFNIEELPDIGGTAATFLHYIVTKWSTLPTQTLFLATTKTGNFNPLYKNRIHTHYAGQGFPVADAEPKTGFLSLGESQTCRCNECSDTYGWEDTFGLIPSMWNAVRPNQTACDSVLLTYSNNFFASSARIHGIKKDIWELLYEALTKKDIGNSWAHDKAKLPKMFPGEKKLGRWGEGGVYEHPDSVHTPIMGNTMERLWGVLLQCSTAEIAWRCPGLNVGERLGGEKADCGCIDELAPGFI